MSCYVRLGQVVSGKSRLFIFLQVSSGKLMSGCFSSGDVKLDHVMTG
jgi:hypothetical protein